MSTASALEREIECAASAVLSPIVNESGEAAERGGAIHVFSRSVIASAAITDETALMTARAIYLAAVPEGPWRETCEQIDFADLCGGLREVRAEVAYRISTNDDGEETVKFIGLNLGRRYPPRAANDVDGTNDFEGIDESTGYWCVTDIKTGYWPVTACRDNPQMKFHARALMLLHGVDRVIARIAYIGVGGEISWDVHIFTRLELDLFSDELEERKGRIARANELLKSGGRLEVHAGDWCRYCPAMDVCPRYTALAHAMLTDLRDAHAKWGAMTEEERGRVTLMAFEARDLAERIVETQKARARQTPIDLGKGKILKDTGKSVRIVNAPKPERRRRVA